MATKKESEANYDVSTHVLVFKHELLSGKDREEVEKKYGEIKHFPRIFLSDPAIKNLNAQAGDLIRIKRSNPSGDYYYYRVVVNA